MAYRQAVKAQDFDSCIVGSNPTTQVVPTSPNGYKGAVLKTDVPWRTWFVGSNPTVGVLGIDIIKFHLLNLNSKYVIYVNIRSMIIYEKSRKKI